MRRPSSIPVESAAVVNRLATLRSRSRTRPREFYSGYLSAIAVSAVACVALFWLGLRGLASVDLLPPPQISNNLCIDEKLSFLRSHSAGSPHALAVGSSITWRTFDGNAVVEAAHGDDHPLNGAFCGLHMNQTYFTLQFFLQHFPSIRDVLTIVAPLDLTGCAAVKTRVFDPEDADGFVYQRIPSFRFYLKYFDPITLARNVAILKKIRTGNVPLDALKFDRFGAGPLDTDSRGPGLVYDVLPPLDPVCFASLHDMAQQMAAEGRRLVVVTMPVNPVWKHEYDRDGAVLGKMTTDLRQALNGTGAIFWDANDQWPMRSEAFLDAMHVRWSAAEAFSRVIVSRTGFGAEAR